MRSHTKLRHMFKEYLPTERHHFTSQVQMFYSCYPSEADIHLAEYFCIYQHPSSLNWMVVGYCSGYAFQAGECCLILTLSDSKSPWAGLLALHSLSSVMQKSQIVLDENLTNYVNLNFLFCLKLICRINKLNVHLRRILSQMFMI